MYDIVVFVACVAVGISVTNKVIPSVLVALVVTSIYAYCLRYSSQPTVETMTSGSKSSKKKRGSGKRTMKKFIRNRKFRKDTYNFDPEKTLQETYRSLTKDQTSGLNRDTKELIKTQQQLMGTLKDMGPVLEQGKTIISAFDSFFKDSGTKQQDLAYMSKRLGLSNLPTADSVPLDGDVSMRKRKKNK